MIAGFVQFQNKPIIMVAYLKIEYSEAEIKFVNLSKDSKDVEIAPALPEEIPIKEETILQKLDMKIAEKEAALRDAQAKKAYFVTNFKNYFKEQATEEK